MTAPLVPAYLDRPRIGDWGMTVTGRQFWPEDPRVGDVCIEDIAHALAYQCRFGGMTREHYSVAQHSVLVSELCSERNKLVGLLHDATEAYLQDIIRPLKRALGNAYRDLDKPWAIAIGLTFGLDDRLLVLPEEVHRADRMVLVRERIDLMPARQWPPEPMLGYPIVPWPAEVAKRVFLGEFERLGGRQ